MSVTPMLCAETTDQIIKAFYHVYNTLGYGFLGKVYENALRITLEKWGHDVQQQRPVAVYFEGAEVGEYFAGLLVDRRVMIECTSADGIDPAHEAQLLNYLKATQIEVGLVLNFGPKAMFCRKVFANDRKRGLAVRAR